MSQHNYDQRQITVNIDSPTYKSYGPNPTFGRLPLTPRSLRATGPYGQPAPSTPVQPAGTSVSKQRPVDQPLALSTPAEPPPAPGSIQDYANMTAELPVGTAEQQAPADIQTLLTTYDDNTATFRSKHWDGSPDISSPHQQCQQAYTAYLSSARRKIEMKGIDEPERPDWHTSDDEDLSLSNDRQLSRQEMKQLDRELPWCEIMEMPAAAKDQFVQSATTEYNGWMKWTGIKPISEHEAKKIYASPQMRKRIIKSRGAYKDKSKGTGPLQAKTRVVIIGCQDPGLRQLTRDSPRPTRLSEYLILSIAASGANMLFNVDGKKWYLCLSDAAQAFLQGSQDPSERNGPLYMEPPKDPIQREAGAFPALLYEITGNCYGLANAPRVWFNKVKTKLLGANFIQHSFDRCLFYHISEDDGSLDVVLIMHVDDFMCTYSESFPLQLLEDLFGWGSVTKIDENHPGEYRGKEITMINDNGKMSYKVTQKKFLDNLTEGKLKTGRLQLDPSLTADELKEMRSVCGCLRWIGGQTRPDVASTASLSHRGSETDINDLKRLHDTLKYAKATADSGLVFPAIPFNKASTIVTFADSGWANAAKISSQFGVMIALCPAQVTEKTSHGFILDWKSGRSARLCRSTFAAEACAADEGTDRSTYLNMMITELLYQKPAFYGEMRMNAVHITDAGCQIVIRLSGGREPCAERKTGNDEHPKCSTSSAAFSNPMGAHSSDDS